MPMEYLMRLWPCTGKSSLLMLEKPFLNTRPRLDQREMWQPYRYQLVNYCLDAGLEPPQTWVPPIVLPSGPGSGSSPGSGAGSTAAV